MGFFKLNCTLDTALDSIVRAFSRSHLGILLALDCFCLVLFFVCLWCLLVSFGFWGFCLCGFFGLCLVGDFLFYLLSDLLLFACFFFKVTFSTSD